MEANARMEMQAARTRRAYELGRIRSATLRAALLCAAVAVLARILGQPLWRGLPVTFVVWFGVYYWGRGLLRGGVRGLVAGMVTALVPLSWLRPCCTPGAMARGMAVCTMPGLCVLEGGLIGLTLAAFLPRRGNPLENALGMGLGVLSLVWLKCELLLWGEALGLLGGLLAGIAAMTLATRRPLRA